MRSRQVARATLRIKMGWSAIHIRPRRLEGAGGVGPRVVAEARALHGGVVLPARRGVAQHGVARLHVLEDGLRRRPQRVARLVRVVPQRQMPVCLRSVRRDRLATLSSQTDANRPTHTGLTDPRAGSTAYAHVQAHPPKNTDRDGWCFTVFPGCFTLSSQTHCRVVCRQ